MIENNSVENVFEYLGVSLSVGDADVENVSNSDLKAQVGFYFV